MTQDTWHVTPDTWHMTRDAWYVTPDTWHLTPDMWHMVGGEHSLKMSAPYLLRFGCNDVLKVWRKRITEWINDWMNE